MNIRTGSLLVRGLILTESCVVFAQVLGKSGIASLFFTLTFPLTGALWLVTAWKKLDLTNLLVLGILLVSGGCVAGNALGAGTAVFGGYFKKLIMFWCTLLLFGAMEAYVPEKEDVSMLVRCCRVLAVFLTGMYLFRREEMHLLNGIVTESLTFRFSNPNLTAVFLSALSMILWIRGAWEKGMARLLSAAMAGVLAVFVWETRARNGQLLLLFFGAFCLFRRLFPGSRAKFTGLAAAPLAFALVYLWLVPKFTELGWFSFLVGEGKGLDSRVEIWRFALKYVAASPLLGSYSQISQGSGASQMHNSHVDILASYGVLTLVLVCLFLWDLLGKNDKTPWNRLSRDGFGALLLSGLGEAVLFSGGLGVYVFGGCLLMLAKAREDTDGK